MYDVDTILYGQVGSRCLSLMNGYGGDASYCGYQPLIPRATGERINLLERLIQSHCLAVGGAYVKTSQKLDDHHTYLHTELVLIVPDGIKKPVMRAADLLKPVQTDQDELSRLYQLQLEELRQALVAVLQEEDGLTKTVAERQLRIYVTGLYP